MEHGEILTRYKENVLIVTVVKQVEQMPGKAVGFLVLETLKLS